MLKATTTEIVIHSDSDDLLCQETTTINLVNEGGGYFITLTQYNYAHEEIVIRLDSTEIPLLFGSMKALLDQVNL